MNRGDLLPCQVVETNDPAPPSSQLIPVSGPRSPPLPRTGPPSSPDGDRTSQGGGGGGGSGPRRTKTEQRRKGPESTFIGVQRVEGGGRRLGHRASGLQTPRRVSDRRDEEKGVGVLKG